MKWLLIVLLATASFAGESVTCYPEAKQLELDQALKAGVGCKVELAKCLNVKPLECPKLKEPEVNRANRRWHFWATLGVAFFGSGMMVGGVL